MKILVYSAKPFEIPYLEEANSGKFELGITSEMLSAETANKAKGYEAISIFTSDDAAAPVIRLLSGVGVRFIAIRASGYDNVDIDAAIENNIQVANVPAYSPHAVAEHSLGLMLALNRKICTATQQVRRQDFTIDNLIGFNMNKKTVGIIGTGRIGSVLVKMLHGMGCSVLAYDVVRNTELTAKYDVRYVDLPALCSQSDIISIHAPLTSETRYLINSSLIGQMKKGVMLINTARGAIVKTEDLLPFLENGHIGGYGMDVYEKEKGIFFFDHSGEELKDPVLKRILGLPNVLITPHQAFATTDALQNIAKGCIANLTAWSENRRSGNELTYTMKGEGIPFMASSF